MKDVLSTLRRARLFSEVSFVLGGAVVGAVTGLVLGLLALPPDEIPFATAPPGSHWFLAVAPGFGYGWWIGLMWSTLLALFARRMRPVPEVAALLPATVRAAFVVVVCTAAGRIVSVDPGTAALVGLVAGTLVARWHLGRK